MSSVSVIIIAVAIVNWLGGFCFGVCLAMLRQKKAWNQHADSFPCWDDEPHETPTWTPGGNE